ncbi:unnamed protein product [Leptidea sinapis]|uniref:AAA+ ATPase domain-containing protein n=1 Tax=Leptidea sinapis TaxID=189913 RepID=A0A5E4R1E2_9NEOP|nr:unnamed protein product [Leptidea sinapis]
MGRRKKLTVLLEANNSEIVDDKSEGTKACSTHEANIPKTELDAFKVMMDSRNKSIGSNSPGKERACLESDSQELSDKKELKAKRMLSLQKMAEAKGSLKNKAIEEYRDRFIEEKIVKRAERLKNFIEQKEKHKLPKASNQIKVEKKPEPPVVKINEDVDLNVKKSLQLCNMFEMSDKLFEGKNKVCKNLTKEDEEFLSKLSPSLRKKENMLSYFETVPKKSPENVEDNLNHDKSQNIIKVKFKKHIKKSRKIISNPTVPVSSETLDVSESDVKTKSIINCDPDPNMKSEEVHILSKSPSSSQSPDHRPKRNVKRPAKYSHSISSSSDEEYNIFTPKKKKCHTVMENITKSNNKNGINHICIEPPVLVVKEKSNSKTLTEDNCYKVQHTKKPKTVESSKICTKLAPIFQSKSHLNAEAKQKFLQSGFPEILKRNSCQQQLNVQTESFNSVVHVQQQVAKHSNNINVLDICLRNNILVDDEVKFEYKNDIIQNLLNLNTLQINSKIALCDINKNDLLQNIKKSYEKFPVYRTYHLLKGKSKGDFRDYIYPDLDNSVEIINGLKNSEEEYTDKLCWTDKYKPTSSKQIIGNFTAIDEMKKWLQNWTENLIKTKSEMNSSDSDFSLFHDSDADSREYLKNNNNVLIISGDVGCGKTSSVYAIAAELAIKVIEVNASSKRTGKIMLQDLQEATKSHKVDRGKSGSEGSQKMQEKKKKLSKKRGRIKKTKKFLKINEVSEEIISQDNVRTGMSLILIDDADVVFEQDDGFCSAVSQLIQSSKRPVILVTSSLTCPHLQRFIQIAKVVQMRRFMPHMLGVWLDILCLADMGASCPGLGSRMLNFHNGDIRKTINCLQFCMVTHKNTMKIDDIDNQELNIHDESSSLSWADQECATENTVCLVNIKSDVSKKFIDTQIRNLINNSPVKMLGMWWSIPKMFEMNGRREQIDIVATMLDGISTADYTGKCYSESNFCFIEGRIWGSKENASVMESEVIDYYNKNKEVGNDIAAELTGKGESFIPPSHFDKISKSSCSA